MRCARCGKMITNRMIKINGTVLCPECAKEAGLGNMFPDPEAMANDMMKGFFDADFASTVIPLMGELDFAPSRIQTKCPKCGTSLKDFESTGLLGCIECYNTFNESIMREMLKNQANSQYAGRKPGQNSEIISNGISQMGDGSEATEATEGAEETEEKIDNNASKTSADSKSKSEEQKTDVTEKKKSIKATKDKNLLEKLSRADLGTVSDADLKKGMQMAVEKEDYALAAKLRDELKGREEKK